MQYMLLIYADETAMADATPGQIEDMEVAFRAFTEALVAAEALVSANRLQPAANATTVRGVQLHDGPFAETKEELGGYYLIDVPDLDTALGWAKKCPGSAYGAIEVRPIFEMTPGTPPYVPVG